MSALSRFLSMLDSRSEEVHLVDIYCFWCCFKAYIFQDLLLNSFVLYILINTEDFELIASD